MTVVAVVDSGMLSAKVLTLHDGVSSLTSLTVTVRVVVAELAPPFSKA
jgi:hypothetical protein